MAVYCKCCGALVMAVGTIADAKRQYQHVTPDGQRHEWCPFCCSNPANAAACREACEKSPEGTMYREDK